MLSPASRDSVKTSVFSWQPLSYFALNNPRDTVFACNKRIRLCNDVSIDPTRDTLIAWNPIGARAHGFIPVSVGFFFKNKIPTPAFFIGLKYDSLPQGHGASEIRIYRFDQSTGDWFVEYGSQLDNKANIVYFKTQNLNLPFVAMLDTVSPSVKHAGPFSAAAANLDVDDTFIVADNVSNLSCRFYFSKGEFSYASGDSDARTLTQRSDSLFTIIPALTVCADNGTRAIFIASDGAHFDTVNASRQVIRQQHSDVVASVPLQWLPLHATAAPDSPSLRYALRNFARQGTWKYDNTAFRVFAWTPCNLNTKDTNKYL